jgi:Type I restriction enzyme R protein N terminus (HSDR_N)
MDRNNKNNPDNENGLKEESELIKKIQSILHEEYGYSPKQMGYQVPLGEDSQRIADLVVFDENQSPIIIVEIKKGRFVLPLSEYQLKEPLLYSKAHFGLLYNGIEKRAYQRIGNSLVQIKDIPKEKFFRMRSTNKTIQKFKPSVFPKEQIWRLAEFAQRDFFDYDALLQALALKILDKEIFDGKLFEKYHTKPFDEKDVIQLIEVGKKNFPIIFSSSKFSYDQRTKTKFIQLLDTIKNFSFQKSHVETISRAILKFSLGKDWPITFPEDLIYFMLSFLSIQKNKILVPYAGQGYYFYIPKVLGKNDNNNNKHE